MQVQCLIDRVLLPALCEHRAILALAFFGTFAFPGAERARESRSWPHSRDMLDSKVVQRPDFPSSEAQDEGQKRRAGLVCVVARLPDQSSDRQYLRRRALVL